jgi:hypothetical protein
MADCGLTDYERFDDSNFFILEPNTNIINELPRTEPNKKNTLITRVGESFVINSVRADLLSNTFSIFLGIDSGDETVHYSQLQDVDGKVFIVDNSPYPTDSFFHVGERFYYFYNDGDDLVLRYYDERNELISSQIKIDSGYKLESAQLVEDMFVIIVTKANIENLFNNVDRVPEGKRLAIMLAEKNVLEYVISHNPGKLDYDLVDIPFENIVENNRTVSNKIDADAGYLIFSGESLASVNKKGEDSWNLKKALDPNLQGEYIPREDYLIPDIKIDSDSNSINGTIFKTGKSKTGIWVDKDIQDKTLYARLKFKGTDASKNNKQFDPNVATVGSPDYEGRRRIVSSHDLDTDMTIGIHWNLYKSGGEFRLELTNGLLDVVKLGDDLVTNLSPTSIQRSTLFSNDTTLISGGNETLAKSEGSIFEADFDEEFLNVTISTSSVRKENILNSGRVNVSYDSYVKATLSRTRDDGTQVWAELKTRLISTQPLVTENIFINPDHQYTIDWDYFSAERGVLPPDMIRDVHYAFDGYLIESYDFEPSEPFLSTRENIKPVDMAENAGSIGAYVYKYAQEMRVHSKIKSDVYARRNVVLPLKLDSYTNTLLYQLTKKDIFNYLRFAKVPEQIFNRNPFSLDIGADNSNYTLWLNMQGIRDAFFLQLFNKTLEDGNVLNVEPSQIYETMSNQAYDRDRYYVVYHFDKIKEDPVVLLEDVELVNDYDLYFIGNVKNGNSDSLVRNYMNRVKEVYMYKPEDVYKTSFFNIEIDARDERDRGSFINNINEIQDFAHKIVGHWKPAHTELERITTKDSLIMAELFNDEFSQVVIGFTPDDNTLAYYVRTNELNKFNIFTANNLLNTGVDWIALGKIDNPYVKSGITRLKRNVNNFKVFFDSEFPDRNYRAFVYSPNNTKLFLPVESLDTDGFVVEGAAPFKDELAWIALRTSDVINGSFEWVAPKPWSGDQIINTTDIFFPEGKLINQDYSLIISTDTNVNVWVEGDSKYGDNGGPNIKVDNRISFIDGSPNPNYLNEGQFFTIKRSSYDPVRVSWLAIPNGTKWWLDIRG